MKNRKLGITLIIIWIVGLFWFFSQTSTSNETLAAATPSYPAQTEMIPSFTPTFRWESKTPTLTATPITPPSNTPLPSLLHLSYELIWVREGEIHYWNFLNRTTRVFVGSTSTVRFYINEEVVDYKITDVGIMAVGLKIKHDSEKGVLIININEGTALHKVPIYSSWYGPIYSISPDGTKLAYVALNRIEPQSDPLWDFNYFYNIMIFDIKTGEQEKIGECADTNYWSLWCESDPVWSSDSRYVAWRGDGGLSIYDSVENRKWLVIEDYIDPDGKEANHLKYNAVEWSPDNKYILVYQREWEQGRMFVLNTRSMKYEEVPYTFSTYGGGYSIERWLSDGRLLVIWFPGLHEGVPKISVYQFKPGKDPWFIEEFSFELEISGDQFVVDGFELSEDEFIFATSSLVGSGTYIYKLNLNDRSIKQLAWLDIDGYEIYWTPDKAWMLVTDHEKVLFTPIHGGEVYDISSNFEEGDYYFSWLVRE